MVTSTSNGKSNAPALIVFGTPKGTKAPHGAWFPVQYAERSLAAAQQQGLIALPVDSDPSRAAAAQLKEGQLKAGGQLVLPTISPQLLSRLRDLAPQTQTPAQDVRQGSTTPGVQAPAALWNTLKPTDVVLAAFLDRSGEPDGWYEATIMKVENGIYTLRWLYEPQLGFIKLQRQHIALMFPG